MHTYTMPLSDFWLFESVGCKAPSRHQLTHSSSAQLFSPAAFPQTRRLCGRLTIGTMGLNRPMVASVFSQHNGTGKWKKQSVWSQAKDTKDQQVCIWKGAFPCVSHHDKQTPASAFINVYHLFNSSVIYTLQNWCLEDVFDFMPTYGSTMAL